MDKQAEQSDQKQVARGSKRQFVIQAIPTLSAANKTIHSTTKAANNRDQGRVTEMVQAGITKGFRCSLLLLCLACIIPAGHGFAPLGFLRPAFGQRQVAGLHYTGQPHFLQEPGRDEPGFRGTPSLLVRGVSLNRFHKFNDITQGKVDSLFDKIESLGLDLGEVSCEIMQAHLCTILGLILAYNASAILHNFRA